MKLIADGKLQKDIDNELLERSGITEEHDQPVSSHQEPCLSDSSQSSKRKREADHGENSYSWLFYYFLLCFRIMCLNLICASCDTGPAIKIRLPLRKHREPEEPKSEYQVGSSSARVGNADSFTQLASASDHQLQSISNIENNQLPGNSDSGHGKRLQSLVPGDTPVSNIILDDKSRREFSLYDSLLQIPQVTYDGYDSADEAWLFRSEPTEAKPILKKLKYDSEAALRCSSSMWPRAQHLPEVGIYALPYTVPF